MYKSGKFWVVAGLTVVSLITANDTSKVFDLFSDRLGSVFAAQTNSSATIDTVTDADTATGGSRTVSWNGSSTWNYSDVTGLGSYNGSTWTADRAYGSTLYKDPAGAYYTKLVANGASTAGYTYLTRQFDATKTFTVTGYLHPNVRDADQFMTRDYSDWTGLLLTPTDPNKIATAYDFSSKGGGGLGIEGMKNAYAFGIDFHKNTDKNDPAEGPFGALRTTNSSGTLTATQGKQSGVAGTATYTDGYNLSNWSSTIKYTLTWNPTGGPSGGPSIVATMTTNKTQNSESSSWTVDTAKAKVTLAPATALTVGLNAINGQNKNDQYASFDSMSGTLSTGTTTVKYVDANGNTIKDPTTFVAAVGDVIGISGLSSGAKAGTDDMAFAAPTIRGYTASSANDVTVSQTAGSNVITIKYKGTVQQEAIVNTNKPELWNGSSAITSYWNIDQTKPLGGSSLASSIVDASLVRSGYNYTVTDPNGSSYATMSAAYAAATNAWDSTSNSAGVASDASPQNWTVNYTAQSQTAYLYAQNYTYNGTSYVTSGSPSYTSNWAQGQTNGPISFNTTDSALAKSGYTYTVQGTDGVTEYATLASAQAAEQFDNTNNSDRTDNSYQTFTVNYRPATQTTSLVVDGLSPIKAGSIVTSSVGTTSAALTMPYTDASLSTAGYTYVVKGPNGSTYSTLSSAVAANSIYDATNNSGATDSSAQVFTVSYVGQTQAAVIMYDPKGPLSAGSTFTASSGATNTSISFAKNDGDLVKAGYTYTVTYAGSDKPDSVAYTTLSSALAAHPRYDSTAYTGTTDTSSQAFIVTYKINQYAHLITSAVDTSGHSLLNYSAISEIANGPASSTISFSNKDSQLAKSGYTYVVQVYDQMSSAASLLGSYTTLASAVAAQKYDNTQNAQNAQTDAYQQQFKVVYTPKKATVTYNYVDQSGKTISSAISETGPVGSEIPGYPQSIQGYTLVSSSGDTDGKFDDDLVSTITYTYNAQYQSANVVIDSSSPINANSVFDSAAGVTSGSISFQKPESQLAVDGYTYVVYAPNGSSYATLSAATAANSLYDDTKNGTTLSDSSPQTFRVSYKADYQSAYIRVQQNSPINAGSMVDSISGSTGGPMSFSQTDSNLSVSGYRYQVGYGSDVSRITYYSTLADAISAAGGKFDSTNNTTSNDGSVQSFLVNYIPMSQSAVINVASESPISANAKSVMSASGTTGNAIDFKPSAPFTTADSQLAIPGYAYTVTYGEDKSSYSTLSAAVSAHSKFNSNNTFDGNDELPDIFTIKYSAMSQSAYIAVTSDSPISAGNPIDSSAGVTSGNIIFTKNDQNLAKSGYTYKVIGPNSQEYDNLSLALAANAKYDNTTNTGPNDSAVQRFLVSYSAAYQEAQLVASATGPYTSESQLTNPATGVTSGLISFKNYTDSDLTQAGYHYSVVVGSQSYATLSAALISNARFDATDNGSASSDQTPQIFKVVYTADSQSAVVQVATNSPINAGQTMGSAAGVTSGSISFAADTEKSLYSQGYHYTVTGPDGSTYSTLASAVAANSSFDNTTNTGSIDGSAQSFVVNYTPDYQAAELQVDGSSVDSISGKTGDSMTPFTKNDSDLIRSGSSYAVYYVTPEGSSEPYATLSEAMADYTTFDNTPNDGSSDSDKQIFSVSYSALSQGAAVVVDNSSPILAGSPVDSAAGETGGRISLSATDTILHQSGYTYTVVGPDGSSYSTLSAASLANSLYDNTTYQSGTDPSIQTFTVSYSALTQLAEIVMGGNGIASHSASAVLDSASGSTSASISFSLTDSDLISYANDSYRYSVQAPDGKTYTTLSSALTGATGYYNNDDYQNGVDPQVQKFTVNYEILKKEAQLVVSSDKGYAHAGQLLADFTVEQNSDGKIELAFSEGVKYADGKSASGERVTDESIQRLEMAQGYTYKVQVQYTDGTPPVVYDGFDDAIDANSSFDEKTPENGILKFVIIPNASYQEAVVNVDFHGTTSSFVTSDGHTGGEIKFSGDVESSLAVSGYTYVVSVNGSEYATLSSAVAAVGTYDNTVNGANEKDSSVQSFDVSYIADYQSANVQFVGNSDASDLAMASAAFEGTTSGSDSSVFIAPEGYYFTDSQSSYANVSTSVASDETMLSMGFVYDNTDNPTASDSNPQNFEFTLAPSKQSGNITYSYESSEPTDKLDNVPLDGHTGKTVEGDITAPKGYYIYSIKDDSDSYTVVFNDDSRTYAKYTLTLDATPNGNAITDSKPQNLVVTFAPGNQRATVSQTMPMPDGTTTTKTVDTQDGRTDKDYSYEYTAPSGYYVADDGITTDGKGLISGDISNDGRTVKLNGNFDNNYTHFADENKETDPEPQNTTIKLTASKQIAQFQIKVPDGATSVSQNTSTVPGFTGKTIEAPDSYSDEQLNKVKGYTYTVTGPDGVVYNTVADALAANLNFDATNNGSSDTDDEPQQFVVTYKADQQTAIITQKYADGAENTPTFPQENPTLKNFTDQFTTGTITAPKG